MQSRRSFTGALLGLAASHGLTAAPDGPAWMGVAEGGELLRRKKLSPVEWTTACLDRIEKLNPRLNAFITVTAEQALADARRMESELQTGKARGALHGVPFALKDLIDTAGIRTTAGSKLFESRMPERDAEVVRRLKAAGAILLGKLNMDEFAFNFTSETSFFGAIHNPWELARSPGGSSGGSAVAVAAGLCCAALGSDTGGSIRLPAAFTGTTGLKPTYGRISCNGVLPLASSLDHVGPLCRSAADAAIVTVALAGHDQMPAAETILRTRVKQLRLGIPRKLFYEKIDPEVEAAMGRATEVLARLTQGAREVTLPELPMSSEMPIFSVTYSDIIMAEAYAYHERTIKAKPDHYDNRTRTTIESGARVSTPSYIRARRHLDQLRAESGRLFQEADLLITPIAPGAAFRLGDPPDLIYLRNCAPWNVYGLPSISIPCGFAAGKLPVGLQITGSAGREDLALALAHAYQAETNWHRERPAL